jgi:hypothetical protein
MKRILFLLLTLQTFSLHGNIQYINIRNIPDYEKYSTQFTFLAQNVQYFNHWVPEWTYDVNKDSLILGLKNCFTTFSQLDSNNIEINLLLGDISHYLYNLNEEEYNDNAIRHYHKAKELDSNDYRTFWFLGNHYTLSANQSESVKNFLKAQTMLPKKVPADFWNEFAYATALANMPSHSIYAMSKAKETLKEPGYFEAQLGETIRKRIVPVDRDSSYNYNKIWSASVSDYTTFYCRPLGLKIIVDSTWNINLYPYKEGQSFVTIVPPAIESKSGRNITYTIAIIIKAAEKGDKIETFINNFLSSYPVINKVNFSNKYDDMIAFEIKNKNMYKEIGGAHMNMLGISREEPLFPGLKLEEPMSIPMDGKSGEMTYYTVGNSLGRFAGTLYYAIMLDACEDIYPQALKVFTDMFNNQIIIE